MFMGWHFRRSRVGFMGFRRRIQRQQFLGHLDNVLYKNFWKQPHFPTGASMNKILVVSQIGLQS